MIMNHCGYDPHSDSTTRFRESASPVSTASMMLLNEDSLHKVGAPIMDTNKHAASPAPDKKPLKGILKKKNRRKTTKEISGKASSNGTSFRRCVSFSGLCDSRWDAAPTLGSSVPEHMKLNVGSHINSPPTRPGNNLIWSSDGSSGDVPKTAQSPRFPRRLVEAPATTEGILPPPPTSTSRQAAPMRRPRRIRSHENLFQHKIDFFLEQTANHQKQMEDDLSKSTPNHHQVAAACKPKDIEQLETSLLDMQKFLVALHSVPNNQKLLQKHMEHQTSLQAQIDHEHLLQNQRRRQEATPDAVVEDDEQDDDDDDEEEDDVSLDYSDEEEDDDDDDDDDEDYEEFLQEIQKQPLPMMGSNLFDISQTEATDAHDDDQDWDDALCF